MQSGTKYQYAVIPYCGEYFDEETGFVYLRGRYYDPATERFITEDPMKDGGNWYAYCGNDPVNFVDPSGYVTVYRNGQAIAATIVNGKTVVAGGLKTGDLVLVSAKAGTLYTVGAVDKNGLASKSDKVDLSKIKVTFGSGVNSSVVSEKSKNVVKTAMYIAGLNSATITSTIRTKQEQVNAMYSNILKAGLKSQRGLYKTGVGKDVLDSYEAAFNAGKSKADTKTAMLNAIPAGDGPFTSLSQHMVSATQYNKINVLDLGYSSLGGMQAALGNVFQTFKDIGILNDAKREDGNRCLHIGIFQ